MDVSISKYPFLRCTGNIELCILWPWPQALPKSSAWPDKTPENPVRDDQCTLLWVLRALHSHHYFARGPKHLQKRVHKSEISHWGWPKHCSWLTTLFTSKVQTNTFDCFVAHAHTRRLFCGQGCGQGRGPALPSPVWPAIETTFDHSPNSSSPCYSLLKTLFEGELSWRSWRACGESHTWPKPWPLPCAPPGHLVGLLGHRVWSVICS